jgi:hypothetical protein
MEHPLPLLEIADAQRRELFPAQAVVEERGEDCPVTFAFEGGIGRCVEKQPGLLIA